MLILIAESKTMGRCARPVAPETFDAHRPALEAEADAIMESLREASAEELAADVKISLPLARKLCEMVYEFPNKALGGEAVREYTGVVFKALDYPSMSAREQASFCRRVRIISSLYGWLRPDDIVKQYRFDFTTPLAPEGKTFAAYWRGAVTDTLLKTLEAGGFEDVLNLLPGDAARCVDWKAVAARAKVWKVDFQEILPGGKTRTPNAGRLKTLRGRLLRQIIRENVTTPASLLTLEGPGYAPAATQANPAKSPNTILFHTLPD